jgi:hypothetical protein
MSVTDKEKVGTLFTWVFRVLTGLGAFFLYGIYNQIQEQTHMLVRIQIESAGVSYKLQEHDREINRLQECCSGRTAQPFRDTYNPAN